MPINKKKILFISVICCTICCLITSCGTLGGIGDGIYFHTSKKKLDIALDSLFNQHPEYIVPTEWKQFNNWSARGYDFLESKIFYFKNQPEEMYYVTFIGDSITLLDTSKIGIGIQAINKGNYKWELDSDLDSKERKRILKRFDDEIISKLMEYTKVRTWKESPYF